MANEHNPVSDLRKIKRRIYASTSATILYIWIVAILYQGWQEILFCKANKRTGLKSRKKPAETARYVERETSENACSCTVERGVGDRCV